MLKTKFSKNKQTNKETEKYPKKVKVNLNKKTRDTVIQENKGRNFRRTYYEKLWFSESELH